jgi:hypothetical protein
MTERFLNIIAIDLDNFLYYDHKQKSYAICDRKDMMEWQENNNIQLKLQYISQYEARKVSTSVNKEDNFNQKVEHLHMLRGQDKTLRENLEDEIDKMKINQTSRLDYIQDIIQKQFKILDSIDRFLHPELFKVIEKSIAQSRAIFVYESARYEAEINESEAHLKNQALEDAIKQQQEFTDFLKSKFKAQSYLDLPE